MKKIYRIIFLVVLIFHTGKVCAEDTIPQVVNPNEYLKLAQEKNFISMPYHPHVLYYLDKDMAFRLADLEMKYIITHGYDGNLFIYLQDFSVLSDTNPEIGNIFFNYYNNLMGKRNHSQFWTMKYFID